MSRNSDRALFTVDQRVSLVEQDLDRFEQGVSDLRKTLNRQTLAFVGAVISFATAATLLAWQLSLAHR